jgi:hypothetical protein
MVPPLQNHVRRPALSARGTQRVAARGVAALLWIFLVLFCLRVAGQALVVFFDVPWLPPMAAWQSGLLPYPWLLLSQIVIVVLFARISLDVGRGRGVFSEPRAWLGAAMLAFAVPYLLAMLVRYGVRMSLYPGERWVGGSIPTVFHWVLAGFLLTSGHHHWRRANPATRAGVRTRLARGPLLAAAVAILALALWGGAYLARLPPPKT